MMICTTTICQIPCGLLYCVPEQRPSIIVDLARLITVLFGEAPKMIALPLKNSVPVSLTGSVRQDLRPFSTVDICEDMPQ